MTSATVSDPVGSTFQIFDTMVESGLKFQEASMKGFTNAVETARAPYPWQRDNGESLKKASSTIQTSVEDAERAMRENVSAAIEMYEKSFGYRSRLEKIPFSRPGGDQQELTAASPNPVSRCEFLLVPVPAKRDHLAAKLTPSQTAPDTSASARSSIRTAGPVWSSFGASDCAPCEPMPRQPYGPKPRCCIGGPILARAC